MAAPSLQNFFTIDIDTNGNLYVLSTIRTENGPGLYYASLMAEDGLMNFNKTITTNGQDGVWYNQGHKALVYNNNDILITGYSLVSDDASGSDVMAIKVPNTDTILDGDFGRWSITTPTVYIVVATADFDVTDTGFTPTPASILLDTDPITIQNSEVTGSEITPLNGVGAFKVKIEGGLSINDAYELPTVGGIAGQVLKMPGIGSKLVWGTGDGGGNLQSILDAGNSATNSSIRMFEDLGGYGYITVIDGYGMRSEDDNNHIGVFGSGYLNLTNNFNRSLSANYNSVILQNANAMTTIEPGSIILNDIDNGGAITLTGTFSNTSYQRFQDKSGVIATIDDIVGSNPNLQQVTATGNTSSNNISLQDGGGELNLIADGFPAVQLTAMDNQHVIGLQATTDSNSTALSYQNNGGLLAVVADTISTGQSRLQKFQDKDGIIATLDDIVPITITGSVGTLQQVTTNGATTSRPISIVSASGSRATVSAIDFGAFSQAEVGVFDKTGYNSVSIVSGDSTISSTPRIRFGGTSSTTSLNVYPAAMSGHNTLYFPDESFGVMVTANNNFNGSNRLPKIYVGSDVKNGGGTTFNLSHSLGATPSYVNVTPLSLAASAQYYVASISSTNIQVIYATATPAVSNNMSWHYMAYLLVP